MDHPPPNHLATMLFGAPGGAWVPQAQGPSGPRTASGGGNGPVRPSRVPCGAIAATASARPPERRPVHFPHLVPFHVRPVFHQLQPFCSPTFPSTRPRPPPTHRTETSPPVLIRPGPSALPSLPGRCASWFSSLPSASCHRCTVLCKPSGRAVSSIGPNFRTSLAFEPRISDSPKTPPPPNTTRIPSILTSTLTSAFASPSTSSSSSSSSSSRFPY